MSATRLTFIEAQELQPQALERIATRLSALLEGGSFPSLTTLRRPLFVGIGASYAALALPVGMLESRGIAARRMIASDVVLNATVAESDAIIAVSQGGKSVETLEAFARTGIEERIVVLNRTNSPLGEAASTVFDLGDEPDSWASTIGYTGTLIALSMIARTVAGENATREWEGIAQRVIDFRASADAVIAELSAGLKAVSTADIIASHDSACTAEAGALLFREVARVASTASRTRNYLHGEMESAGNSLHVVFGEGREIELAHTLADAGHLTLLITTADVPSNGKLHVLRLPDVETPVRAVLETIAMQVLATVLASVHDVDIEDFVFANHDIKVGGITEVEFKK